MNDSRILAVRASIALGAALGCGWAHASDPWPEPRPIARDTPAFRAPAEVPAEPATEKPPAPEPSAPLTLPDALSLALSRNPELAAFSWETRASEARALQAGKLPNPELDFRLYRLGIPRPNVQDEARKRVLLSQVLELGGKRRRRVDLAQTERELAGWDYEAKRIEVATAAAGRFAAVLGAQRRVASSRRFVEFLEQMRDRVATLVELGAVGSVELHRVSRQVGLAKIELRGAEGRLSTARFGLAATWGGLSPQFTEAVGDLERSQSIPDIDTLLDLARQSPAIARLDAELARGRAALALAKADRVPDLTYGAGIRWEQGFDERDYLVDVEIALPILDRKQGEVREARYDMARAKSARRAAEAARSEEIASAYYRLEESEATRSTLRDEVIPAARATFDALRAGFDRQVADPDDLLDARRDLARAEADYTDALVDYHENLADLERLVGQSLLPAD